MSKVEENWKYTFPVEIEFEQDHRKERELVRLRTDLADANRHRFLAEIECAKLKLDITKLKTSLALSRKLACAGDVLRWALSGGWICAECCINKARDAYDQAARDCRKEAHTHRRG